MMNPDGSMYSTQASFFLNKTTVSFTPIIHLLYMMYPERSENRDLFFSFQLFYNGLKSV
jgi:hypothetical protein